MTNQQLLESIATPEYDYPVFTPWNPNCYIGRDYVSQWKLKQGEIYTDIFAGTVPCWHSAKITGAYRQF